MVIVAIELAREFQSLTQMIKRRKAVKIHGLFGFKPKCSGQTVGEHFSDASDFFRDLSGLADRIQMTLSGFISALSSRMGGGAFRFRHFVQHCHLAFQSDVDLVNRCRVAAPRLESHLGCETIDSVDRQRVGVAASGFFVDQHQPHGGEQ